MLGTGVTPRDYNRFSATLSGPVFRNRTFFMGSDEKLQDDTIETVTNPVPTDRMRRGDFSELLAIGVQIFVPTTARLVNGVVTRDPFPGNVIPDHRINPIARNILSSFPAANQPGLADQFSAKYEWQSGTPLVFAQNTYFDPAGGDPRDLKSQWGKNANGQVHGVDIPIFDTACFYTLNGQPFGNAAGQVVTWGHGNRVGAAQHSHLSDNAPACAVHVAGRDWEYLKRPRSYECGMALTDSWRIA